MATIDPLTSDDYTYVLVADAIAARIASGQLAGRLPSERDLAREYGVAYQTLRHSMQLLRSRGLVITQQGRGTFVAASAIPPTALPRNG